MARSMMSGLSVADLQREIARRGKAAKGLRAKHARLSKQLAKVEAKLAAVGDFVARGGGGGRTRAKNDGSLAAALASVLKGKVMSVTEVAGAVKKAGYKSNSPNFRTMVNAQLLNRKMFRRESRGKYTAI